MYYRKTCHWQQPSLRESPCRWKSIRNSSAHNVFPNGWLYFFSRKVHFLLILPNYQFTVEMSVRKGARAEPLIFSISQSNSQFPQSKIKSTKRSTPVLNFPKYETVLKTWDLMDCDTVTFPTQPSFPFTEPFAKLSRDTWKFNNHYCPFWFLQ